ncbi:FYVE zinc finger-domain-containing protein, partial [Ochromonadaceae sp. CCMP2298]
MDGSLAAQTAAPAKKMEWEPDNASKTCRVCEIRFRFMKRRHHCRRCGRLVCTACSEGRLRLGLHKNKSRVCLTC